MLKSILISDYILIDELSLDLSPSLNVITGETGAGKSILISAIDVVLGGKCAKDVIKTGCERSFIELTAEIKNKSALLILKENEIDIDADEIVISREITLASSKYRINGMLVHQSIIKQLRPYVLDIHSQHQSYTYIQPKYHINLLDSYIGQEFNLLLDEYSSEYKSYISLKNELEILKNRTVATESKRDFMKFQIEEIENAGIEDVDEDENLKKELHVLENIENLKELTGSIHWTLSGDDNSITDVFSKIRQNLSKAVDLDSTLENVNENFNNLYEMLRDISSELREYSQGLENDTERLNNIQERLYILDKLKRKYGGTLENVLKTYEDLEREYLLIENSDEEILRLENEIRKSENNLYKKAEILSQKRLDCSEKLADLVVKKMELLEMPKSRFEISIKKIDLNEKGFDDVEFMISTNISEPVKPLEKVASGGEISRVMLALKSIFAQNDDIDTVIFDEIDTGISGKASQSVADEISELSKYRQIIMITHQAILAAKADRHIYVKKVQTDKTKIGIYVLSETDRLNALAELASGDITDESLSFAKTLIQA